jgi:hypothetical protein
MVGFKGSHLTCFIITRPLAHTHSLLLGNTLLLLLLPLLLLLQALLLVVRLLLNVDRRLRELGLEQLPLWL